RGGAGGGGRIAGRRAPLSADRLFRGRSAAAARDRQADGEGGRGRLPAAAVGPALDGRDRQAAGKNQSGSVQSRERSRAWRLALDRRVDRAGRLARHSLFEISLLKKIEPVRLAHRGAQSERKDWERER